MKDHDHHHKSDNTNNLSALTAGLVIGAAFVYLFATEDGKKLKEQLILEGKKILENMGQEVNKAQDQIEEAKEKVVEVAQQVESVADVVQDLVVEVPQHIAAVQKKGRKFFFHRSQPHHAAES